MHQGVIKPLEKKTVSEIIKYLNGTVSPLKLHKEAQKKICKQRFEQTERAVVTTVTKWEDEESRKRRGVGGAEAAAAAA